MRDGETINRMYSSIQTCHLIPQIILYHHRHLENNWWCWLCCYHYILIDICFLGFSQLSTHIRIEHADTVFFNCQYLTHAPWSLLLLSILISNLLISTQEEMNKYLAINMNLAGHFSEIVFINSITLIYSVVLTPVYHLQIGYTWIWNCIADTYIIYLKWIDRYMDRSPEVTAEML